MPDYETVTLHDPSSPLSATFVVNAGMVATSLCDDGVELLGQRRGLDAYVSTGRTMGIPILYPWANRLSGNSYPVDGGVVTLKPGTGGVRMDQHGVPIHGVLAAYSGWKVTTRLESRLTAELDYAGRPGLLASFPFPHTVTLDIELADRTLTVTTTITPISSSAVPLCFGFHPYLQIPEVPRPEWQIETPRMRHRPVNAWGIPTGESTEVAESTQQLGDKFFDDGYADVAPGSVFAVSGGDRRIEVCFQEGYTAAQIFAPGDEDVICFEPMAAPTDALNRGNYRRAEPGAPATTKFTITV